MEAARRAQSGHPWLLEGASLSRLARASGNRAYLRRTAATVRSMSVAAQRWTGRGTSGAPRLRLGKTSPPGLGPASGSSGVVRRRPPPRTGGSGAARDARGGTRPQAPHRDGRIGSVAERVGEHRPEVPVGAVAEQGAQKAVVVLGLRRLVR